LLFDPNNSRRGVHWTDVVSCQDAGKIGTPSANGQCWKKCVGQP